jgi:hypothetical protein
MLELLGTYSLTQIVTFIVLLAIAVKEGITLVIWFKDLFKRKFKDDMRNTVATKKQNEQMCKVKEDIQLLIQNQEKIFEEIELFKQKLEMIIESDKDDIKSWITEKHHFYCYERKWIDDYSMDCIERRYGHYKDEGGNSFIEELMNDLRSLPKTPPQQ